MQTTSMPWYNRDSYERIRTLIRDELGVSPSDWLQSIHSGLLRNH